MTTVIWNGNTLVADSQCTNLGTGEKSFDAVKIKAVEKLTYRGEKIQAVAVAGWARLLGAFWDIFKADVTDEDFFTEAKTFKHNGSVIIVTDTKAVKISIDDGVVSFTEHPRSTALVIGSGTPHVRPVMEGVSPELAVSYAMKKDPHSGGTLTTWTGGAVNTGKAPIRAFVTIRTIWAAIKVGIDKATKEHELQSTLTA